MNISTLWIAEKPSMAEAFASQLGVINNKDHSLGAYVSQDKSVVVTWLYGHLVRDLMPEEYDPEMKSWKLETLPFFPQNWKKTPRENVVSHFQKVKNSSRLQLTSFWPLILIVKVKLSVVNYLMNVGTAGRWNA